MTAPAIAAFTPLDMGSILVFATSAASALPPDAAAAICGTAPRPGDFLAAPALRRPYPRWLLLPPAGHGATAPPPCMAA